MKAQNGCGKYGNLRWIYCKIKNECFQEYLGITTISDKIEKNLFEMVCACPM